MKTALDIAQQFFSSYRSHDLDGMLECFSANGRIDYLPIGLEGPAREDGRQIWEGLIEAFPNLTNQVTATYQDGDGRTLVFEVTISGTQARDAFGIRNKGRHFDLPHVFIIRTGDDQRISWMKAYWDNSAWFLALGRTSLLDDADS
ncbi:nuclear transport factor 2 family protein [Pseudomonas sp. BN417]|uniref:nuclear transport factor 2 family protein n=1 Tax=Pseudomonas sp. BN417 TaxID=2567890 RepID=UPI0024537DB2|nr:nuclear transport factor 2 family protein [Pseudomonas sp. BN417]